MKNNERQRDSGIDLLRIFAAIGVILIHIGDGRISGIDADSINHYVLIIIESIVHCCVDLFILITGFYSIYSVKRSLGKPLSLLFQVLLFQVIWYFLLVLTGRVQISLYSICDFCTPNNYFVILFIVLYFLSPYINRLMLSFTQRELNVFMTFILCLFSLYAIGVDLYSELMNKKWFGLSSFGAWGNQQGFTIINFSVLYIVGAYIKIKNVKNIISKSQAIAWFIVCLFVSSIWAEINFNLPKVGLWSAWCYHNPIMILMAVSLFIIFSNIKCRSMIINRMAPAAFMCYIFHVKILSFLPVDNILILPIYLMLPILLMLVISIFIISWILYELYTLIFARFFKQLDKIVVPYFDNIK